MCNVYDNYFTVFSFVYLLIKNIDINSLEHCSTIKRINFCTMNVFTQSIIIIKLVGFLIVLNDNDSLVSYSNSYTYKITLNNM